MAPGIQFSLLCIVDEAVPGTMTTVMHLLPCTSQERLAKSHVVTVGPSASSSSGAGGAVVLSLNSFNLFWSGGNVMCRSLSSSAAEHGRASGGRWRGVAGVRQFLRNSRETKRISYFTVSCRQNAKAKLDVERAGRTWELRSKAGMGDVGVPLLAEEETAAPENYFEHEESLPSNQDSSEPREIRLKGIRGGDYNGASISSQVWEWRHTSHIHYERAGVENIDAPALLLLPGFGVGSFHYDQQLRDLGQEYRVWAVDFLGQGSSWPSHDPAPVEEAIEEVVQGQVKATLGDWGFGRTAEPWAQELVYSVDTWRDQVHAFIDEVIGEPVYLVGNSLGGYVGTYFAATKPDLVKGITLLNATPFWAFMPNARRYPLLARLVPWAGVLPVPAFVKVITRIWWDILRKPQFLRRLLELVYADRTAINDNLVRQIKQATDHPAAAAAFTSILFAPRAHTDFGENLIRLKEEKIPVCMIYGREDPWVVPFWGQRAKQRIPEAIYYELSPAGHCPHHEAPEVVNSLLRKWVESIASQGAVSPALHKTGASETQKYWFVVELDGLQEKRVSVRIKGHRGFFREWADSIIELFSKFRFRTKVVQSLEEVRE